MLEGFSDSLGRGVVQVLRLAERVEVAYFCVVADCPLLGDVGACLVLWVC